MDGKWIEWMWKVDVESGKWKVARFRISQNNAMQRSLRRSGSFKVTNFGTNRKRIYDFLLVVNTNLPPPILHLSEVMADY